MAIALLVAMGIALVTGVNLPDKADDYLKAPAKQVHFENSENKN